MDTRANLRWIISLCLFNTVALAAPSASAEDTRAESVIENVVVTATRRKERIQDVPISVTAVSGTELSGAGIESVRDLTHVVPGLYSARLVGAFLPVIRGVGSSSSAPADESTVATYVDGIYQPDIYGAAYDFVEVERVEVLRGPQGTIFGRNATGGLINIITPDPSFEPKAKIQAKYGWMRHQENADDYDVQAYLTGGLSESIAADLAASYTKNDGYVENLLNGSPAGDSEAFSVRSKVMFLLTDRIDITLTGSYAEQDSVNSFQPHKGNTFARTIPGAIIPTKPWQTSASTPGLWENDRLSFSLQMQIQFNGMDLETSTGYTHNTVNEVRGDPDASNIVIASTRIFDMEIDSLSQEIRLLSTDDGPFKWIIGAYFFDLDADVPVEVGINPPPITPGSPTMLSLHPKLDTRSYAVFGEGTYEFSDSWFLTLGARYTWEERTFAPSVFGNPLPFGKVKTKFEEPTVRVALRYNFSDSSNIYASYNTGFKSGVFNALSTSPLAVDPETIDAFEVGLKMDPLTWLRTNLSLYYYDYKDLQVSARDNTGVVRLQNAANAEIYGSELELDIVATDNLAIRASVAYNHSEYQDFEAAQVFVPLPGGGNMGIIEDVSGNDLTRAPRTTFNLGFVYDWEIAGGRAQFRGNVFRSAKLYHDFNNLRPQKAYTQASGEIAWTTPDETWRFSVWATNITNEEVAQQIQPTGLADVSFLEKPRRVGVGVQANF